MDNINFSKINNLTYVERVVQISDYDYILYINLNKTSDNIKELILKYQPEFSNLIKININNTKSYKIINNNTFKLSLFSNIQLSNKLIKIDLVFSEKYLNFYIKDLIVYDKEEDNKKNIKNHKKFNTNKNIIIRKIVKI